MNNMKCIMCGKGVSSFPGYVTDGIVYVCDKCAASNSLMRVVTRIENDADKSNLVSVFSEPIEVSGYDQTEIELAHDIDNMSHDDFFSKYVANPSALSAYIHANGEPEFV